MGLVADLNEAKKKDTDKEEGEKENLKEGEEVESLAGTEEENVEEEMAEEEEEEEEIGKGLEAPEVIKSKRISKGIDKLTYPKKSKKKRDLPQLDDVPRKKRELLEASTTAANKTKVYLPSLSFFFFFRLSFLILVSPLLQI